MMLIVGAQAAPGVRVSLRNQMVGGDVTYFSEQVDAAHAQAVHEVVQRVAQLDWRQHPRECRGGRQAVKRALRLADVQPGL